MSSPLIEVKFESEIWFNLWTPEIRARLINIVQNADNFFKFFVCVNRNYVIKSCGFVEQLKYADLVSVIDENSPTERKNYKAVSILQNI